MRKAENLMFKNLTVKGKSAPHLRIFRGCDAPFAFCLSRMDELDVDYTLHTSVNRS